MMRFNNVVAFPFLLASLACAAAQSETFDTLLEDMLNEVKESSMRMEQMMSGFSKVIEEAWSKPQVSLQVNTDQPVNINYDNENEVIVRITFPENVLKEVEAQTNEKNNVLEVSVTQDQETMNITIDRNSIKFARKQSVEKRSKDKDDGKDFISHISYQSQSSYQTLSAPVQAAKARLKIKGDDLIITLPREHEVKKLTIEREK